ncbi:MAG TPA: hypothetical protein ENG14_03580 [Thermodesulforhabdus norvegica]|uniref:VanZ-like domain-containing protein n=1 Tax=Thermodesulforhabdus norvegica TaxID=39841 RepID=A0A7C0WVF4_9BACT|nr:hypothetical protein [Thermodesulforhabdus norvegica]
MAKKYLFVAASFLYAALIFYLSSIPSLANPLSTPFFLYLHQKMIELGLEFLGIPFYLAYRYPDKFAHMMLYLGFGLILNLAMRSMAVRRPEILSILLGSVYGVTDEYHQSFVPYRSASVTDLIADITGLVMSQIVLLLIVRLRRR